MAPKRHFEINWPLVAFAKVKDSLKFLKDKYLTEPQPYGGYQPTYGVFGPKPYGTPSHYDPPPTFGSYGVNYPPPAAEPYTPPTYRGYSQPPPAYGGYGVTYQPYEHYGPRPLPTNGGYGVNYPPPAAAPYTPPTYGGYSQPPPGYGSYGVTNPPPAPYAPPTYGGYSKPPAPQPYSTYFTHLFTL